MSNASRHTTRVSAGPLHTRRALLTLTATALLFAGCDQMPTEPDAVGDAAAELAAVQEVWNDLPSSLTIEAEAMSDLDGGTLSGEIAASLLDAGDLAAEADAALDLGDDPDALDAAADTLATRSYMGSLGVNRAAAVLAAVERAMASIDARLAGNAGSEARLRLSEASEALSRARQARSAGDAGGTLMYAALAADALRWLDPETKARAAVAAATAILERAQELAGDDPEPPIARALARAEIFCQAGSRALESELWRVAVVQAHACARVARSVIVRLGGGIDPDVLAERAEEAIAHAGALLDRAVEEAGPEPEARVAALLTEAEGLLGRAEVAFDEERFRIAIGLAIESSARSLRVLRILRQDDSSPYELRATAAVEVALALSARVDAQIDDSTPQEIVEAAERTDGILAEAEAALEAGEFRTAWGLARHAIKLYVRILLALQ